MDELDAQIQELLAEQGLVVSGGAVARVRQDIEGARECAATRLERPRMRKRDAQKAQRAAQVLMELRANEATADELRMLRRIKRDAEVDLLTPPAHGPSERPWIWWNCRLMLETWRLLTDAPDGVWSRDEPSPALKYLTACCQLVDPTVTKSTILRSKTNWERAQRLEPDFESYRAWSESELAQKLREPDL